MVNSLTRQAGLKLGPIILDVLVKHYFERLSKDHEASDMPKLMQEELLYDEAFNIVKSFMEAATKHTVEELQEFSNTRTPSPPWVHVVRLLVPMPCCDEAATYLIKAMGGEEVTKRVVGGTKWWQVRGLKGIDAEWIVAKKDWQEAKRRQKARDASTDGGTPSLDAAAAQQPQEMPETYQPEMDEMRCILYAHGGGYYFGSFDQERYVMQRLARKINGRVFAINYRLAPQYPFPCAPQDFLAAYLYLIRPPPGALHTPVLPSNIVFAGDSAGGGLCIALLQIIRDSGLPAPSGAVLVSPWCDLTHSFPSIHINTPTDIIPPYGLSFHKPSTLWPPPPDDLTLQVRQSLRSRIRDVLRHKSKDGKDVKQQSDLIAAEKKSAPPGATIPDYTVPVTDSNTGRSLHLGSVGTLPVPLGGMRTQHISLATPQGETLSIDGQIHMYAPNYLLTHPLVSPVVSYLGGLPPMLVIASDKEVLRDEIIYFAHKAAHPEQYPVKSETRLLYPALEGIEERHSKPSQVHLQVYDDAAHTLPVLFAFTTPGKYCFRAMAVFIKYITGMLPAPNGGMPTVLEDAFTTASPSGSQSNLAGVRSNGHTGQSSKSPSAPPFTTSQSDPLISSQARPDTEPTDGSVAHANGGDKPKANGLPHRKAPAGADGKSGRRAFSAHVTRASAFLRRHPSTTSGAGSSGQGRDSSGSSDVAGPRFHEKSGGPEGLRYAGELDVYDNGLVSDTMIRERVSTRGVIRALEPEPELSAFKLPPELVGEVSELALRRYIDGDTKFSRKFGKTAKEIEKARRRTLERAKRDAMRNKGQLHPFLNAEHEPFEGAEASGSAQAPSEKGGEGGGRRTAGREAPPGSWAWAWALDADEHPPPSSIVARRDTEEARRLAKIADQAVFMDEHSVSGNNLWSLIVNFLTVTPERDGHKHHHTNGHGHGHEHGHQHPSAAEKGKAPEHGGEYPASHEGENGDAVGGEGAARITAKQSKRDRFVSKFAHLVTERKKSPGVIAVAHDQAEQ
ncbi:alpha/beta-hydrolase [Lenzites betulinus]|nr:alpha/beta-hydrolase [Lenzites betulinus]